MFLTCCSSMSSKARSSLPATSSCTRAETQMPPGSARPSRRAATFTPSPKMSPPSIMMSPTLITHPEFDPLFRGYLSVALSHAALDFDSATHGVHYAGELNQHPVPGGLRDPAAM